MTIIDPIIAVKDVIRSSSWYQSIFRCTSLHGGDAFDVLVDEQDKVLICLHKWGDHGHPTMLDHTILPGNGLILYFRTNNMDSIRKQIQELGITVEEELHLNVNSNKMEFSLRDPDGYYLTITELHEYEG